jgi:hypothetical protein
MLNNNSGMWKWPKIKFGPRIFVMDIIKILMCKINERTILPKYNGGKTHGKL